MTNKQEVIELFSRYGFKHRPKYSGLGYEAFTYRSGFFYNAELVSLKCWGIDSTREEIKKSSIALEAAGFSTKYSNYQSLEELENSLFHGFFDVTEWCKKVMAEYDKHCVRCLSAFPDVELVYKYIHGSYTRNGIDQSEHLIDLVSNTISEKGPILSIIEAPAGFGKTCSSYEILKKVVDSFDEKIVPFFAEFSRDRQARVFSHILIREVDRSFSSVSSEVVIQEIKNGRVVVILDGFDELLHDETGEISLDSQFETAEPMLETISELLTGNAKVILTSRRSAIFDGNAFNEWISRYEGTFNVNRYRLNKPTISDWLPWERQQKINKLDIDLENLANPVLLGYLRFATDDTFEKITSQPYTIVSHYFTAMMEREMERQNLLIKPDEQFLILQKIASDMCEKNYISDTKEHIIELILNSCSEILQDTRKLYAPKDRPTVEKLASTLSNHAFLDRCDDSDNVRFVNEFVFGNFIASCAISENEWLAHDERFVEPAVLSYVSRANEQRLKLWNGLSSMIDFLTKSDRARFESLLTKKITPSAYSGEDISSVRFSKLTMFPDGILEKTVFNECTFSEVIFIGESLSDITFINCEFWGCDFNCDPISDDLHFYNCRDDSNFIKGRILFQESESETDEYNLSAAETYVLSKFFQSSAKSIERLQIYVGLIFRSDKYSKKDLERAIRSLKRRGFLVNANDHKFVAINKEMIGEIKSILSTVL